MQPSRAAAAVDTLDDCASLVARALGGDHAAFESIMRRHNRLMFRTARSLLRSDAECEEAVQDAYLKAWRSLPAFRGESRLSTWLVRIVMNEALTRLRRRRDTVLPFSALGSGPQAFSDHSDPPSEADEGRGDPERAAALQELVRIIEAHVDALPQQFRTVFVLRAFEEMSVEEVAQALQVPEATVRTRFFRARALLREALARDIDFATEDAFAFAGERCDRIVARVLGALATAADGLDPEEHASWTSS